MHQKVQLIAIKVQPVVSHDKGSTQTFHRADGAATGDEMQNIHLEPAERR
jgi:hypothetical protein